MQLIIERYSGLAVHQETVVGLPSDRPCGRAAAEGGDAYLSHVDAGCRLANSEKPSPGWPRHSCGARLRPPRPTNRPRTFVAFRFDRESWAKDRT